MLTRSTCLLLLGCTIGCGTRGELTSVFGSLQAIESIKQATAVNAYRLPSPSEYRDLLGDYEMATGPIEVSDGPSSNLRDVLLDPSTYGWDYAKGCIPDYGVRIQFQDDTNDVDVLLCFDCDILAIYHNGKAVGSEDFDDGRDQFVAIVKTLFPGDQDIQSLE